MQVNVVDTSKPILGYMLRHRIGSGGYGEVWAAEAPGGLPKAVKFIFGYHDEKRAQSELKALNRIRSVRHPFLLSLERIDVVDDQLVVITELADMCLKARFLECLESGSGGIPRAELLSYLRDAAGALDFISQQSQLQHLDIKPENLLLVGGHIKVADFGLVKDIHDGTQSLMSGLTPAYAPPELFDGRPSIHSDQYSLAIVFQEMLTGQRPFDGKTAVQLASQHLHDRPNLRPLPRSDQSVVSKALAKDPEARFATCGAMIDALIEEASRPRVASRNTRSRSRSPKGRRQVKTSFETTPTIANLSHEFALRETESTKLPTLDYRAADATFRPTLFLGLGHTGTQVLRQLRKRLTDRNGDKESLPSVKLFCLDTDASDLADACSARRNEGLTASELMAMPLMRPEDYRKNARIHLSWLSRRWIYNVPKSLKTEGIRPLGRLALATHIDELTDKLQRALSDLTKTELLAQTAEALDLDPRDRPRVYVVGSVSGGTCSGMAIDLAYIVRSVMRQLGVVNEDVVGVFAHGSSYRDQRRELPIANSLAFLSELYHFSHVEAYPGDESCGIQPSTDGTPTPTFSSTYFLHLGDEMTEQEFENQVDSIAEYLYLNTATRCGAFMEQCRQSEGNTGGLALRSFGLSRSNCGQPAVVDPWADLLASQVIKTWTENPTAAEFDAANTANDILVQHAGTSDTLTPLVDEALTQVWEDPIGAITQTLAEQAVPKNPNATMERIEHEVDRLFGPQATDSPEKPAAAATRALYDRYCREQHPKLSTAVLDLVDHPDVRIGGAQAVAEELKQRLEDQRQQVQRYLNTALNDIPVTIDAAAAAVGQRENPSIPQLAETLLKQTTLDCILKITQSLQQLVGELVDELENLQSQCVISVRSPENATANRVDFDSPQANFQQSLEDYLQERIAGLAASVDQHLQRGVLSQHGGLKAVLHDEHLLEAFRMNLRDATRSAIVQQLEELDLSQVLNSEQAAEFAQWASAESLAVPAKHSGATRWMHAYPRCANAVETFVSAATKELGQNPTVIPATIGELVCCIESEQVPLDNLARVLLKDRPDSIEFASRLHARVDVEWTRVSSMR